MVNSADRRSNVRASLVLPAILAVALAFRLWGLGFGLPHTLARPDEDAVVTIALRFFSRTLNPEFFHWPSLFMYVVAAIFVVYFNIGRIADWFDYEGDFIALAPVFPVPLYLIARSLSVAAGVATVWTVHRLGLQLFNRSVAAVAALFLAVSALHVRDSHFGVTDVAATSLLTLSFLWTTRYAAGRSMRALALSAICAGLAASTKYNAALVALPAVWAIAWGAGASVESWSTPLSRLTAYAALAAAAFVIGTPYSLLDAPGFLTGLREVADHLRGGHVAYDGAAWMVHLTSSLRYGLGWPLLAAAIAGLALYVSRDRRNGVVFALFPLVYFAAIGAGQTAFARYIIPLLPFCALAAAYLVTEAARPIAARLQRPLLTPAFAAAFAALIALPTLVSAIRTNVILSRPDTRVLAAAWIDRELPQGGTMYQTGSGYGHLQMQTVDYAGAARYPQMTYDAHANAFLGGDNRPASGIPDIIVVQESPLAYSTVPDAIRGLTASHYERRQAFHAVDVSSPSLVYDWEDAFFVPLAGFEAVERPGPNVTIYVRRVPR
jgi:hypothetical protein